MTLNPGTKKWVDAAEKALKSLHEKYKKNKGLILTEGDLQCYLFHELLNLDEFKQNENGHYSKTKSYWKNGTHVNGVDCKTGHVHSEVTWFKREQLSGYEVDIMILDPEFLEVVNFEKFRDQFERKVPHKAYAYDGPCVAIELKFSRFEEASENKTSTQKNYTQLRDLIIPDKMYNIDLGMYQDCKKEDVAFISLIGCKDKDKFREAKFDLGEVLCEEGKPCPDNLFVWLFSQDDIITNKDEFISVYKLNK